MTFFPPANPNAAYIDEDTGAVVRPAPRRQQRQRNTATEPPESNQTPAFFDQGSPSDFLDVNDVGPSTKGNDPVGNFFNNLWNGRGIFAGAPAAPSAPASDSSPSEPAEIPNYPTTAVTRTIAPSRDYQAEGQASPTGRDSSRVAPDGTRQTGTRMGPKPASLEDVNALLSRQGVGPLSNPFESTNLPATNTYQPANTNVGPVADGREYGGSLGIDGVGPVINGDAYADMVQNPQNAPVSPTNSGNVPGDSAGDPTLRFNAKEYKVDPNNDGVQYAPPVLNQSPKRSILDYDDVMTGLRAVEADRGYAYVGGQYVMANPNAGKEGESDLMQISKENVYDLKAGGDRAQSFLQSKLNEVKQDPADTSVVPEDAAVSPEDGPKSGNEGISGIGPVRDGETYANNLRDYDDEGTTGIGPFADGNRYASNFPRRR